MSSATPNKASTPSRRRYFHEHVEIDEREQRGDPILFDEIPEATRYKVGHRVIGLLSRDAVRMVEGQLRGAVGMASIRDVGLFMMSCSVPHFWTSVEACLDVAMRVADEYGIDAPSYTGVLLCAREINVLLGDECIGYRVVPSDDDCYFVHRIDAAVLHREIVDRTFEITRSKPFAAANTDYQEGWKAYSKGDFHDAIFKAGKAMESAQKILIRKLDPKVDEKITAAKLAERLFDLDILPSPLKTFESQLRALCAHSTGPVRNLPGIGHGSADLVSAEAALALLMLNVSGSLIVFLVQAYERRQ